MLDAAMLDDDTHASTSTGVMRGIPVVTTVLQTVSVVPKP